MTLLILVLVAMIATATLVLIIGKYNLMAHRAVKLSKIISRRGMAALSLRNIKFINKVSLLDSLFIIIFLIIEDLKYDLRLFGYKYLKFDIKIIILNLIVVVVIVVVIIINGDNSPIIFFGAIKPSSFRKNEGNYNIHNKKNKKELKAAKEAAASLIRNKYLESKRDQDLDLLIKFVDKKQTDFEEKVKKSNEIIGLIDLLNIFKKSKNKKKDILKPTLIKNKVKVKKLAENKKIVENVWNKEVVENEAEREVENKKLANIKKRLAKAEERRNNRRNRYFKKGKKGVKAPLFKRKNKKVRVRSNQKLKRKNIVRRIKHSSNNVILNLDNFIINNLIGLFNKSIKDNNIKAARKYAALLLEKDIDVSYIINNKKKSNRKIRSLRLKIKKRLGSNFNNRVMPKIVINEDMKEEGMYSVKGHIIFLKSNNRRVLVHELVHAFQIDKDEIEAGRISGVYSTRKPSNGRFFCSAKNIKGDDMFKRQLKKALGEIVKNKDNICLSDIIDESNNKCIDKIDSNRHCKELTTKFGVEGKKILNTYLTSEAYYCKKKIIVDNLSVDVIDIGKFEDQDLREVHHSGDEITYVDRKTKVYGFREIDVSFIKIANKGAKLMDMSLAKLTEDEKIFVINNNVPEFYEGEQLRIEGTTGNYKFVIYNEDGSIAKMENRNMMAWFPTGGGGQKAKQISLFKIKDIPSGMSAIDFKIEVFKDAFGIDSISDAKSIDTILKRSALINTDLFATWLTIDQIKEVTGDAFDKFEDYIEFYKNEYPEIWETRGLIPFINIGTYKMKAAIVKADFYTRYGILERGHDGQMIADYDAYKENHHIYGELPTPWAYQVRAYGGALVKGVLYLIKGLKAETGYDMIIPDTCAKIYSNPEDKDIVEVDVSLNILKFLHEDADGAISKQNVENLINITKSFIDKVISDADKKAKEILNYSDKELMKALSETVDEDSWKFFLLNWNQQNGDTNGMPFGKSIVESIKRGMSAQKILNVASMTLKGLEGVHYGVIGCDPIVLALPFIKNKDTRTEIYNGILKGSEFWFNGMNAEVAFEKSPQGASDESWNCSLNTNNFKLNTETIKYSRMDYKGIMMHGADVSEHICDEDPRAEFIDDNIEDIFRKVILEYGKDKLRFEEALLLSADYMLLVIAGSDNDGDAFAMIIRKIYNKYGKLLKVYHEKLLGHGNRMIVDLGHFKFNDEINYKNLIKYDNVKILSYPTVDRDKNASDKAWENLFPSCNIIFKQKLASTGDGINKQMNNAMINIFNSVPVGIFIKGISWFKHTNINIADKMNMHDYFIFFNTLIKEGGNTILDANGNVEKTMMLSLGRNYDGGICIIDENSKVTSFYVEIGEYRKLRENAWNKHKYTTSFKSVFINRFFSKKFKKMVYGKLNLSKILDNSGNFKEKQKGLKRRPLIDEGKIFITFSKNRNINGEEKSSLILWYSGKSSFLSCNCKHGKKLPFVYLDEKGMACPLCGSKLVKVNTDDNYRPLSEINIPNDIFNNEGMADRLISNIERFTPYDDVSGYVISNILEYIVNDYAKSFNGDNTSIFKDECTYREYLDPRWMAYFKSLDIRNIEKKLYDITYKIYGYYISKRMDALKELDASYDNASKLNSARKQLLNDIDKDVKTKLWKNIKGILKGKENADKIMVTALVLVGHGKFNNGAKYGLEMALKLFPETFLKVIEEVKLFEDDFGFDIKGNINNKGIIISENGFDSAFNGVDVKKHSNFTINEDGKTIHVDLIETIPESSEKVMKEDTGKDEEICDVEDINEDENAEVFDSIGDALNSNIGEDKEDEEDEEEEVFDSIGDALGKIVDSVESEDKPEVPKIIKEDKPVGTYVPKKLYLYIPLTSTITKNILKEHLMTTMTGIFKSTGNGKDDNRIFINSGEKGLNITAKVMGERNSLDHLYGGIKFKSVEYGIDSKGRPIAVINALFVQKETINVKIVKRQIKLNNTKNIMNNVDGKLLTVFTDRIMNHNTGLFEYVNILRYNGEDLFEVVMPTENNLKSAYLNILNNKAIVCHSIKDVDGVLVMSVIKFDDMVQDGTRDKILVENDGKTYPKTTRNVFTKNPLYPNYMDLTDTNPKNIKNKVKEICNKLSNQKTFNKLALTYGFTLITGSTKLSRKAGILMKGIVDMLDTFIESHRIINQRTKKINGEFKKVGGVVVIDNLETKSKMNDKVSKNENKATKSKKQPRVTPDNNSPKNKVKEDVSVQSSIKWFKSNEYTNKLLFLKVKDLGNSIWLPIVMTNGKLSLTMLQSKMNWLVKTANANPNNIYVMKKDIGLNVVDTPMYVTIVSGIMSSVNNIIWDDNKPEPNKTPKVNEPKKKVVKVIETTIKKKDIKGYVDIVVPAISDAKKVVPELKIIWSNDFPNEAGMIRYDEKLKVIKVNSNTFSYNYFKDYIRNRDKQQIAHRLHICANDLFELCNNKHALLSFLLLYEIGHVVCPQRGEFLGIDNNVEAAEYAISKMIKKNNKSKKEVKALDLYTDGSFKDGKIGWGFCTEDAKIQEYGGVTGDDALMKQRNIAGEMKAVIEAVKYCFNNGIKDVRINYDYEGVKKWATGEWRAKNKYTKQYVSYINKGRKSMSIKFNHIKGHTGNEGNDLADRLAAKGRDYNSKW